MTDEVWDQFLADTKALAADVRKIRAVNVNRDAEKSSAKALSQTYFRDIRSSLLSSGIDTARIETLDSSFGTLFKLSQNNNAKTSYSNILSSLMSSLGAVAIAREVTFSINVEPGGGSSIQHSPLEKLIVQSLSQMLPTASASYEQALVDLADDSRVSYRGPANELRECLRELLDHLAPSEEVEASPNFRLEANTNRPTMKQKVRYILKARQESATKRDTPERSAELVEGLVGSLARAVYDRASLSSHVTTTRTEVRTAKTYLDGVLADLLQVH